MELVARDVEVGEIVVLLFDFHIALRELRVLELDLIEPLADGRALLLERRDPRHELVAQLLPVGRVARRRLLAVGDRREPAAQPLVLFQQLAGELRALVEQGEEVLRARAELGIVLAHARPFRERPPPPPVAPPRRPTPRHRAGSPARSRRAEARDRRRRCGSPAAACRRSPRSPRTPRSRARPTPGSPARRAGRRRPCPVSTTPTSSGAVRLRRRLEQPVDRGRVAVAAEVRDDARHRAPATDSISRWRPPGASRIVPGSGASPPLASRRAQRGEPIEPLGESAA